MALTWPTDFIAALKTALESRLGTAIPAPTQWAVGDVECSDLGALPRIGWRRSAGVSGKFSAATETGHNPRRILEHRDPWMVTIWASTESNVWTTLQNLVACSCSGSLEGLFEWTLTKVAPEPRGQNSYALDAQVWIVNQLVDAVQCTVEIKGYQAPDGGAVLVDGHEIEDAWPTSLNVP